MSSKYSAVPREENADQIEFNPRAQAPGGPTDGNGIELSELNNTTSTFSLTPNPIQPDSAHSSIAGDESTALVSDLRASEEAEEETAGNTSSTSSTVAGLVILDPEPPREGEIQVTLMRLGGSGLGNIQLNVSHTATVRTLIERVYSPELLEGKRIRLISLGRMLQDGEQLQSCGVSNGQILHVLITTPPPPSESGEVLIGSNDQQFGAPAAGAGGGAFFSQDGYPGNARHYSDHELAVMQQAQLDAQAGRYQQQTGTNTDFVVGFFLGLILGMISLIWFLNSSVSRKQRLGILVGIFVNFFLGYRNAANEQRQQTEGGNTQPGPPTIINPVGNS